MILGKEEVDWRRLSDPSVLQKCMNACLRLCGIGYGLSEQEVREFQVQTWELMCITLYTGPMFEMYNAVLRALGLGAGVVQH